jgi:hypothetical protein
MEPQHSHFSIAHPFAASLIDVHGSLAPDGLPGFN